MHQDLTEEIGSEILFIRNIVCIENKHRIKFFIDNPNLRDNDFEYSICCIKSFPKTKYCTEIGELLKTYLQ